MKIEDIKALVTILEGSSLNYMEISEGDFHLKLGKNVPAATAVETVSPVEAAVPVKSEVAETPSAPVGGTPVPSPMVGVFYAAPSPEAEAFVTVGQTVKKGQVLCIIEAMKLMNEITAEEDGVISAVCITNGHVVEYGTELFRIRR